MAEVSKGCNVPSTKIKVLSRALSRHGTHRSPPSTFLFLLLFVRKKAPMARCFRISFHRVLDEDLAAHFLTPLTKIWISGHDQLNPVGAFFWKGGSLSGTGLVRELPDLCAEHFWILGVLGVQCGTEPFFFAWAGARRKLIMALEKKSGPSNFHFFRAAGK